MEPSAGEGDLLVREIDEVAQELGSHSYVLDGVEMMTGRKRYNYTRMLNDIDTIEIDISKHAILREKGFNVIGIDFLKFESGCMFSHVIMNPPFSHGAEHVLHAWDITYSAEIVAILNAETIRNPHTKERQRLCDLIEEHGSVEFIENAFVDAKRETGVEIALVYLNKVSNYGKDVVGDIWTNLKQDEIYNVGDESFEQTAIMLPKTYIENQVTAFKAADIALRESLFAKHRFSHYASMLGRTLENVGADTSNAHKGLTPKELQREYAQGYKDLKNRAWTSILHSSELKARMSRTARKRFEAEFENIQVLEFNVQTIYGFIQGVVDKQGEIQEEMMLDFFDSITKWHSENNIHYCGYKSNDKHRIGMKVKSTRFILPNNRSWGYISTEAKDMMHDFDKVMAMLDGKAECTFGLYDAFSDREIEKRLEKGERISTDYFDVRAFKVGTIHFYPTRKDIIERLNRRVGALRSWLPEFVSEEDAEFWKHYEASEKADKAVREAIKKESRSSYENPCWVLNRGEEENPIRYRALTEAIYGTVESEMMKIGIDIHKRIESGSKKEKTNEQGQLLLVA